MYCMFHNVVKFSEGPNYFTYCREKMLRMPEQADSRNVIKKLKYCHAYTRRLYKTGWICNWIYWITHSYTQLQCIRSYSSLQFTCRVFTLYLHWFPVFQYSQIRLPATLQLFSEDCCSAQILTRALSLLNSLLSCQLTLMASPAITHSTDCPRSCPAI
jgi:hypothetical protein